ncbi:MAG: hypothetical protein KTR18_06395, partial [Acidiferrobacterales bacterium]|nr:hypothetical protein [Acidiferrobacterales bacterium]
KKFFEVQDGVTETNHGIIDYLVVTSTEWWDGLKPDMRDQLAKILTDVTETRNKEAFTVNQENRQKIVDAGGVVRELDASQRSAWVTALKPVWARFEGDIGADVISAAEASNN